MEVQRTIIFDDFPRKHMVSAMFFLTSRESVTKMRRKWVYEEPGQNRSGIHLYNKIVYLGVNSHSG